MGLNITADLILSTCIPSEKDANAIKVPYYPQTINHHWWDYIKEPIKQIQMHNI